MNRFAFLTLLITTGLALAAPDKTLLTGIWQSSHEIAAGWNETYRFYPDGKVTWNANQMDLEKRLIERSGTWKIEENKLELIFTEEIVLVGGRHAKPDETGEGESVWVGAKTVNRKLLKKLIEVTPIKAPVVRNGYPSVTLFDRRFWKMRTNPDEYN